MNILHYKECDIEKSSGYKEYIRLRYDEKKQVSGVPFVSFFIEYSPETKEVKAKRADGWLTFNEQYYDDKIFEKLYTKVLSENREKLNKPHKFYDEVHKFLNEENIELHPIEIKDLNRDKVGYHLITFNPKYEFEVSVLLQKDGFTLNHLLIRNNQSSPRVSIVDPEKYPAIVAARNKLVQESEFRLKLLFGREEL